MSASDGASEATSISGWKSLAEVVASIGGATAVLSALLLFFGYERTSAYYQYYGVPLGVLGLSPTDYLLDSPDSLFKPVVWATMTALVIYLVTYLLRALRRKALKERAEAGQNLRLAAQIFRSPPRLLRDVYKTPLWCRNSLRAVWLRPWNALDRFVFSALLLVAIVAAAIGIAGLLQRAPAFWGALSLALAAVLILVLYVSHRAGEPDSGRPISALPVICAVLLFGAAFWVVTIYARDLGVDQATRNFFELPEATIYAKNEVILRGAQAARPKPDAQWKYNYPHYRLLQYANGRWVVTHKIKDPDHPDDPERVETFILPRDETNFVVQITDPHFHQG